MKLESLKRMGTEFIIVDQERPLSDYNYSIICDEQGSMAYINNGIYEKMTCKQHR